MITLTGKKISEGIAIGSLSFYKRDTKEIRRIYVKDVEKEVMRFQKARQRDLRRDRRNRNFRRKCRSVGRNYGRYREGK